MKVILLIFGLIAAAIAGDKAARAVKRLSNSNKELTTKLLSEVVKQHPDEDVVLSGYSLLTPLALLSTAAVGNTRDEILKVLSLPDDNETRRVFPLISRRLESVKGVELKAANKIYVDKDLYLNFRFNLKSRLVFKSEVENIDLKQTESASKIINKWVENNTNGLIRDLVSSDSLSDAVSVLVNTLYFKGTWKEKFNKNFTSYMNFNTGKENSVPLVFMIKTSVSLYAKSNELDASLLQLPFKGEEMSLLVVLPNKVDGLKALLDKLKNSEHLDKAVEDLTETRVSVFLPKF